MQFYKVLVTMPLLFLTKKLQNCYLALHIYTYLYAFVHININAFWNIFIHIHKEGIGMWLFDLKLNNCTYLYALSCVQICSTLLSCVIWYNTFNTYFHVERIIAFQPGMHYTIIIRPFAHSPHMLEICIPIDWLLPLIVLLTFSFFKGNSRRHATRGRGCLTFWHYIWRPKGHP